MMAGLFVFPFFLIFCRLGTAVMVFPALSDVSVMARARLLLALAASLVLLPLLRPELPALPSTGSAMMGLVATELVIGLGMGLAARLLLAAMAVTGETIAFMAGFQSATLFDPHNGASTAAPTVFLTLLAGVLILVTNVHHELIRAVVESYRMLPAGQMPPVADMTEAVVTLFGTFTLLGVQLAMPIIIIGVLVNMIFGVFNRLIPQLQVFFLSQPIAIILSLMILAAALPVMMGLFMGKLADNLTLFQVEGS